MRQQNGGAAVEQSRLENFAWLHRHICKRPSGYMIDVDYSSARIQMNDFEVFASRAFAIVHQPTNILRSGKHCALGLPRSS